MNLNYKEKMENSEKIENYTEKKHFLVKSSLFQEIIKYFLLYWYYFLILVFIEIIILFSGEKVYSQAIPTEYKNKILSYVIAAFLFTSTFGLQKILEKKVKCISYKRVLKLSYKYCITNNNITFLQELALICMNIIYNFFSILIKSFFIGKALYKSIIEYKDYIILLWFITIIVLSLFFASLFKEASTKMHIDKINLEKSFTEVIENSRQSIELNVVNEETNNFDYIIKEFNDSTVNFNFILISYLFFMCFFSFIILYFFSDERNISHLYTLFSLFYLLETIGQMIPQFSHGNLFIEKLLDLEKNFKNGHIIINLINKISVRKFKFLNIFTIDELDLLINHEGSIKIFCGASGSGKSTFVKLISGRLPSHDGVSINNIPLESIDTINLMKKFAIVSQGNQFFSQRTVNENLYIPLNDLINSMPKELKSLFQNILKRCQLHGNLLASHLSGGQLTIFKILRALATGKKYLILDEPTTGLDPETRHDVYEIIKCLKSLSYEIWLIEHNLNSIIKYADEIHFFNSKKTLISHYGDYKKICNEDLKQFLICDGISF